MSLYVPDDWEGKGGELSGKWEDGFFRLLPFPHLLYLPVSTYLERLRLKGKRRRRGRGEYSTISVV